MSAESEGREGTRDLDLTPEDADRVKGGMLDPGGGGGAGASHVGRRKRKRRKKQDAIGPYKGKH